MPHILVTGGAGFIGSHLVDSLLRDGCHVTVVDNFDPFYDRSVKERNIIAHRANAHWRLVEADIRDNRSLQQHIGEDVDAIVHLAARAGVRPSLADPTGYQDVNVGGHKLFSNSLADARSSDSCSPPREVSMA
jgi:UDP-glucuronate 4-epimerase